MLESLIVSWIAISGVVTGATTYFKSLLMQVPYFKDGAHADGLSIVLQTLAFFVGTLTAYASGVNVLAGFAPFASAPPLVGYVAIGIACLLGGQGGYILLSVLAGKIVPAAPSIPTTQDVPPLPSAPATYVPFMVVPRALKAPIPRAVTQKAA